MSVGCSLFGSDVRFVRKKTDVRKLLDKSACFRAPHVMEHVLSKNPTSQTSVPAEFSQVGVCLEVGFSGLS